MALLTSLNSRQQDVARFRACHCLCVAAHAGESLMRLMVELRMWHPLQRRVRRRHGWQTQFTGRKVFLLIRQEFGLASG